jgi:hypothetical protein
MVKTKFSSFFYKIVFLFLDQSNSKIDQNDLISLEQVYLKILHRYINESNSYENPYRFNQLLHLREQLNHLTKSLLQDNLFYLPYLLIPN